MRTRSRRDVERDGGRKVIKAVWCLVFGLGKTPFWTPSARVVEGEGCRKRGRGSQAREGWSAINQQPAASDEQRRKPPEEERREAWNKSNSCGRTPWKRLHAIVVRAVRLLVAFDRPRQGSSIIGSRYLELTSLDLWPSRNPLEVPSTNPSMNIPLQALNQRYLLRGIPRPFVSRMHWGLSYPALRHLLNTNVALHNPHLFNHLTPPIRTPAMTRFMLSIQIRYTNTLH